MFVKRPITFGGNILFLLSFIYTSEEYSLQDEHRGLTGQVHALDLRYARQAC